MPESVSCNPRFALRVLGPLLAWALARLAAVCRALAMAVNRCSARIELCDSWRRYFLRLPGLLGLLPPQSSREFRATVLDFAKDVVAARFCALDEPIDSFAVFKLETECASLDVIHRQIGAGQDLGHAFDRSGFAVDPIVHKFRRRRRDQIAIRVILFDGAES